MQNGYDLYPSEYNFKYFTRLQFACSYQGKLQMTNFTHTICDLQHRVIPEPTARSAVPGVSPGRGLLIVHRRRGEVQSGVKVES